MKIVFLQDDFPPQSLGGAGFSTYELASGMQRKGHEVFVITTCRKESEVGEFMHDGLTVFRIKSSYSQRWRPYVSLNNVFVVRKVKILLRKIQPDIVHINNIHGYLSYHCFSIGKKYAKAVVFTARDMMSVCYGKLETSRYLKKFDGHTTWQDHVRQAGKQYNPFRNFFIKRYIAYADKICAVSGSLQKALLQNGVRRVDVLHTGVDVARWGAAEDEKRYFKKKYHLEGKKVVLFGGRLSEGKGGGKTLQAFAQIVEEVPEVVLLVAGSIDTYSEKMRLEAGRLGINDQLIITGWIGRDEVKDAYAVADVVIVPSLYLDPFPRIVLEAMASGKPVVGTCYGGASEIILDGVTGYVVNPLNSDEIALKVTELLKDPIKAQAFGRAGYDRVRKDFNLENNIKEYQGVYETLVIRKTKK